MKNKYTKRLFWKFALLCPKFIRKIIVRSRFKINYSLDSEIEFKIATTKDEIEQALNLVHDSYVNLNYINKNTDRLHLTKYLALPTTTILVVKLKDEVIGTMSIVLNTSLGLPVETTWNINEYKKNGANIAEVSALAIKNGMKQYKGQIFLPLIKLCFLVARDILKLDGFVIATTYEVEPFNTDLLLYEKISDSRGQKHNLVKGNKSSCCFLKLDNSTHENYQKIYSHKDKSSNLHHFFYEANTPNIKLPSKTISVQAQLKEKNKAMVELLKEKPHIFSGFSEAEKLVISNLDSSQQLAPLHKRTVNDRKHPRLVTMIDSRIEVASNNISIPVKVMEVSKDGLKMKWIRDHLDLKINDEILVTMDKRFSTQSFSVKIMWVENDQTFGCMIQSNSKYSWEHFYQTAWSETQEVPQATHLLMKVG